MSHVFTTRVVIPSIAVVGIAGVVYGLRHPNPWIKATAGTVLNLFCLGLIHALQPTEVSFAPVVSIDL